MSTKSCQSCLTLCNPMGSSDHGILQARILEWVAMPSSKDLHDTGIKPTSPVLLDWQVNSLPLSHQGKASFQASGSFPMSWLFTSSGQTTGASASAAVLPKNIQGWFPVGLIGLISLHSKGLSRVFPVPQFESINSLMLSLLYGPTLTSVHDYWKNHSFNKNIIPIHEPLLSWSNHLPEVPPANTITLGIKILTYELWRDTDIQSTARCYWNVVGRDQGCV